MSSQGQIYTVSRLNQAVRQLLETGIGQVWLTGEISNFSAPASGHWYFTLKDDRAQVRCAMFRGRNQQLRRRPKSGDQVLVRARVGLYEPRGEYQLIVEYLEEAGDGLLRQQFEQLKMKLAAEGLFAAARKRPLPDTIRRVGVVTSASGAALQDILHVLARRNAQQQVIIYPSAVQGNEAPQQLIQALARAAERHEVDVVLLARGGGSLEDLWAFNDEGLARAIAAFPLPLVSGVGHEVDTTIADYVADVRAPTPSAAAELVSSDSSQLLQALQQHRQRLTRGLQRQLDRHRQRLLELGRRLRSQQPTRRLERQYQQLDELTARLHSAQQRLLQQRRGQLQQWQDRLLRQLPAAQVAAYRQQLQRQHDQLQRALDQHLAKDRQQLSALAAQLAALSPLATLGRGYSITENARGKVVDSVRKVKVGESIQVRVRDGRIEASVSTVQPASS